MPAFGSNPTIEAVSLADGASVTLGAKADAAVVNPASDASLIALMKGNLTELLALAAKDYATQTTLASVLAQLNVSTAGGYIRPKYSDQGLLISQSVLAGATYVGAFVTGLDWVRTILMFSGSDQTYDVNLFRENTIPTSDWGAMYMNNVAATGLGSLRSNIFPATSASVATSGIIGWGGKWTVKNTSGTTSTIVLELQYLG